MESHRAGLLHEYRTKMSDCHVCFQSVRVYFHKVVTHFWLPDTKLRLFEMPVTTRENLSRNFFLTWATFQRHESEPQRPTPGNWEPSPTFETFFFHKVVTNSRSQVRVELKFEQVERSRSFVARVSLNCDWSSGVTQRSSNNHFRTSWLLMSCDITTPQTKLRISWFVVLKLIKHEKCLKSKRIQHERTTGWGLVTWHWEERFFRN